MRALVTGASGFLGSELTKLLHRNDVSVIACPGPRPSALETRRIEELQRLSIRLLPCDLRRERPFESVPEGWDTLFHLASYVRTEVASEDVRVNDEGTRRLLNQLSLSGKRVLFASTLAVADNAPRGEVTPDTRCAPRTAYGRTKLVAEEIVAQACQEQGGTWTIIRLPTLYGAGYRPGGLFDVLGRLLARQQPLARLDWPGRLALMAVEDAAELLRRSASSSETAGQRYLASSNENPAVWEIAQAIAEAKAVPYDPIRTPGLVKAMLGRLTGRPCQLPGLPHRLQVTAWRTQLLLNGLHCDGAPLARLLGMKFQDWRRGVARMFAEDPPHPGRSAARAES